jgi:hypothetical protein
MKDSDKDEGKAAHQESAPSTLGHAGAEVPKAGVRKDGGNVEASTTDVTPALDEIAATIAFETGKSPPTLDSAQIELDASETRCPITALGTNAGTFWFLTAAGEVLRFSYGQLATKAGLMALVGGQTGLNSWICQNFPRNDRVNKEIGRYSPDAAAAWLMRKCYSAGIYDSLTPLRGRGVWNDNHGRIVVNTGNSVLIDGQRHKPGLRLDGKIYVAAVPMAEPASVPATAAQSQDLIESLSLWNWQTSIANIVIGGWLAIAFLGAAVRWRVHLLAIGAAGSGKTTLVSMIEAVLSSMALSVNDYSEAGLRQLLTSEARAIVLDEAEGQIGRIQKVIELLRRMSSAEGAKVVRGTSGGIPQRFDVNGSAFLAAVIPPDLTPQDATRITKFEMGALPPGSNPAHIEQAIEAARQLSLGLFARMIASYGRYKANLLIWWSELARKGCDPRRSDQSAAILAGWWTLCSDAVVTESEAREILENPEFSILVHLATTDDDSSSMRCLHHLYASVVQDSDSRKLSTIGQWIAEASIQSGGEARKFLQAYGIRVPPPEGDDVPGFWIANRSPALTKLYQGTDWALHGWGADLKRLDGAKSENDPMWIGKSKPRVTFVPRSHMPPVSDIGDD